MMGTTHGEDRQTVEARRTTAPQLSVSDLLVAASTEPEQRVVRQLVEALLFEKLVPYQTRARSEDGSSACEAVFDVQLEFELAGRAYRCLAAIGAFDRVRIAQGTLVSLLAGEPRPVRLAELVASLDIATDARSRLHGELEQTVSLCRWNRENLCHQRASRRRLAFQQLESAIVEGHPYHPCFKTRTGFSLQDHQAYGFETANTFQLEWLAVARSAVRIAIPGEERKFWRQELGDREYDLLGARLAELGGDWEHYALLPIHPWQLRTLRGQLQGELACGEILALGCAGDRYHATQSLRTLVNAAHPERANVKLPLDVVCTSSRRNFAEHFVCTAPVLSDWLTSMVAADPFLSARESLVLLREYAGILYEPQHAALRGRFGVIYRESVCSKLRDGEAAVPFTALTIVESDGRPFIAEWVDEHGARAWAAQLIEVVLIPLWHMLVHHGIAFEAHAQNLILVHRNGWPQRIALRDFHQETEFVLDYLRAPESLPDFATIDPYFATVPDDDGYRMASTESLRELFMDCVYVYNLADVSFLFARYFALPEQAFWDAVRRQLHDYAHAGITDSARIEEVDSDSQEIVVESLLTKKVHDGDLLDFFEHRIRNTLHGSRP
ncbi:MAG TPA: IucA/IucC family protein [Polyangiales bacterium]|nr:IucA/IucC family protein [Polyangiales bacterium]